MIPSFLREYIVVSKQLTLVELRKLSNNNFGVRGDHAQRDAEMVNLSGRKQTKEATTNPMNSSFNE